jgi:hypothetical protein
MWKRGGMMGMQQIADDNEPKECFGTFEEDNTICTLCADKKKCCGVEMAKDKPTGRIYTDDPEHIDELEAHTMELKIPFHDTTEIFEVYECPNCQSHFLVESEAMESLTEIFCPYCKAVFK